MLARSSPHWGHLSMQHCLNFSSQLDQPFCRARCHNFRQGYSVYLCRMGSIMWPTPDQTRANYCLSSPGKGMLERFHCPPYMQDPLLLPGHLSFPSFSYIFELHPGTTYQRFLQLRWCTVYNWSSLASWLASQSRPTPSSRS